ncbi:MAG: M12 family metallo-peptidase [Methanoregula sp.]
MAMMAMVPMVSAEKVIPTSSIMGMKYLSDVPLQTKIISTNPVTISEYSLVTVDPSEFIKNADEGKKLECTLEGEKYSIELTPVPSIIAPGAKLFIKTKEGTTVTDVPRIKQYQGRIIGKKSGNAFFTVDDKVILGRLTTDNESYFISQYGTQDDGKIVHIVYNAKNELTRTELPSGDDIISVTNSPEIVPILEKNHVETTFSTRSVSTVGLLAVYDTQFHNAYPYSSSEIASMMSTVQNAFSPSYIGVNFQINAFCWDSTLTSTNKDTLTNQLIASQRSYRDSTHSDLVSLFTGRNLDGDDIGNAGQYSNGVYEESAYSVEQMTDSGTAYTASSYQRPILISHELGHNFGAMHQTDPGYSGYPFNVPSYARASTWTSWWTTKYSAMWAPFQAGTSMSNEFSAPDTGHGDSNHNNALRISLQKATVAGYK